MLFSTTLKVAGVISPFKNISLLLTNKSCYVNYNGLSLTVRALSISNVNARIVNNTETSIKTIYNGALTGQIKAVKMFSLSSSIVGIIAQPFLYNEIASMGNIPVIIAAYSFIGFFTFVTPLLLHIISRKYVTHLEYNSDVDTYVAHTINFFCMSKKTEFKLEDVKVPDVPGMFTTLLAKKKPLFLDPNFFSRPDHYARLMGYDKPIDFKLTKEDGSPRSEV